MARSLVAGLLIFAFIGVVLVSLQGTPMKTIVTKPLEGFELIKRAAECQCLPGYVPSKESAGGEVICVHYLGNGRSYWYIPSGGNKIFRISAENPCGIPHINTRYEPNTGNYPEIMWPEFSNLICFGGYPIWSPSSTCKYDLMNLPLTPEDMKSKNTITSKSSNYFCQSLSDPSKTRKCY
jgi:hypothetical protein